MTVTWYDIREPWDADYEQATAWFRAAADVLMRIKDLHDRTVTDGRLVCETCQQPWPCATAKQVQRMVVRP